MNFKVTRESFKLNGKDIFIYSGEVHYFRIPKRLWPLHLDKLKKAGCNTVSTYIPWSWHEYEDNKFDFTGRTNPERNLIGFLELVSRMGLLMIVKPGPYILAEYKLHGLPEWLLKKNPQIQAITSRGALHPMHMTTYMHPVFLKYVKRWYKNIMPIIEKYQVYHKKPIIMMQLCNEIAFYYWLSAEGDYNNICIDYYHRFLRKLYKNIIALNKTYKTKYKKFENVPPPRGKVENRKDYLKYKDWYLFYRWYYALYLSYLLRQVKSYKIGIPLFHNLPGWIDGRAVEYPVNVIMYDRLLDMAPEIMLGVDHIPETVDFRNLSDDFVCNEITRALQKRRFPLFGIEIQSGSRHHKTRVYPNELELFYKACLVHGMKGMNLYMFSQGINPPRQGALGTIFYWQTPLDVNAKESKFYKTAKKIGKFIKTHGVNLIKTTTHSEVCLAFYRPYYYTEFTTPAFGDRRINVYDLGLDYDPKSIRDFVLFNGVAKSLQILNQRFNMEDLQNASLYELGKYKQVWVISTDVMDIKTQKKLVKYVKKGGHLIMMPTLADKDLDLNKCDYLYREFSIKRKSVKYPIHPKIDLLGIKDFQSLSRVNIYDDKKAQVIARIAETGESCGITKKIGKGNLILLGTAFTYELEEHLNAFKKLLQTDRLKRYTFCNNPELIVGQLFGKGYSYLYILNYHRDTQAAQLTIKNPKTKDEIKIPAKGKMNIPGTYGLIVPINLKLNKNALIKYTTSEILSIKKGKKQLLLEVNGSSDIQGQIKFIFKSKPKGIFINDKKVRFISKEPLLLYRHLKTAININILSS